MHFLAVFAAVTAVAFAPGGALAACSTKPANIFLAGDSTTAKNGGWGDGFIEFVKSPAKSENHGRSGATTVSFVSGGNWKTVLDKVKGAVTAGNEPFVTIQFGHNDQKTEAKITLDQYQANLEKMTKEVRSNGGTPILLTPLTRRTFSGGKVVENLSDQRTRTLAAASNTGTRVLDLNQASTAFINAIKGAGADTYNLASGDRTHLNPHGATVFGRMVADLMLGHAPVVSGKSDEKAAAECFNGVFKADEALSEKIWSGKVA